MKSYTNPLSKPPSPSKQRPFDPWNSSSTGHQRREAPRLETDGVSETDWRTSRALKVNRQFKTQSHVVPAPTQDTQQQVLQRKKSVMEMLVKPGLMKENSTASTAEERGDLKGKEKMDGGKQQLFAGLVVYVNGSTFPLISDHKLKTLLAEHGARLSLHLARRQVTHVILGRPAGGVKETTKGCGGGLAGTKMDKEIRRVGGQGIKYVGVEWVLECLAAGKRLPEARFSNLKIAAQGQSSVYSLSKKPT